MLIIIFILFCTARANPYKQFLTRQLIHTKISAYAASTISNLRTQWKAYLNFCHLATLRPYPTSPFILSLFAQHLSYSLKSPQSVQNYLSGVRSAIIMVGGDPPPLSHPQIKLTIRGLKRTMSHQIKRALPMDPDILIQIHSLLSFHSNFQSVFWAYCILAFLLMSRKSNLVPDSNAAFDHRKHLTWSDISISQHAVVVTLKWAKNNQFGERQVQIPLLSNPGSPLCPVNAVLCLTTFIPPSPHKSIFRYSTGSKVKILTYPLVMSTLKSVMFALGRDPTLYSSHSFRRGGATYGHLIGLSEHDIQVMGDWASDAYKVYLHGTVQSKVKSAKMFRDSLVHK